MQLDHNFGNNGKQPGSAAYEQRIHRQHLPSEPDGIDGPTVVCILPHQDDDPFERNYSTLDVDGRCDRG